MDSKYAYIHTIGCTNDINRKCEASYKLIKFCYLVMGIQPPTDMERLHNVIRNLRRENTHLKAEVHQLKRALSLISGQVSFKSDYCGVDTA